LATNGPNPRRATAASEKTVMRNGIQLISGGDGLAVIGDQAAVDKFLESKGLLASSRQLDLRRLKPLLTVASDASQTASDIAANSGRWLKLTKESARRVAEHGLMETKTPGVSHVMVGVPGKVQNWLQTEQGLGSLAGNPAVLSGVAGVMAQAAGQQAVAEIADYLAKIDEKARRGAPHAEEPSPGPDGRSRPRPARGDARSSVSVQGIGGHLVEGAERIGDDPGHAGVRVA